MEDKSISLIIFGKPKAFEIYELFENGAVKNIENENKGPVFLPISTSDNMYHFYKEKGYYFYEVYSEAFANNASRSGNLIGFCIKSQNKININSTLINVLKYNFQDIKNASLETNTFIYSNLQTDFINKIKIEKFVSDITASLNSFDTQTKNYSKPEIRMVESGNIEIGNIQLDLDKYEYYISNDERIFKDVINRQKFVELGEEVFEIEGGIISLKKEPIIDNSYNNVSINSLFNQIGKTNDEKKRRELIKKLQDELFFEKRKTKKRNMIIFVICILFALSGVAFGWYSNKMNKVLEEKIKTIQEQGTQITELDTENQNLEHQKVNLQKEKEKLENQKRDLDTEIANKKQELERLKEQAKGTEADLRKQLSALNQELTKEKTDFTNYKKSYQISNTDLPKNYIPISDLDTRGKYFSKSYIEKNFVAISEYDKLKKDYDDLKKKPVETPKQNGISSNTSTNTNNNSTNNSISNNSQTNTTRIDQSNIKNPPFRLLEGNSHTLGIKNKGTKSLTWESSDSNIATVHATSGKIQAVKEGTVEIRLKEGNVVLDEIILKVNSK